MSDQSNKKTGGNIALESFDLAFGFGGAIAALVTVIVVFVILFRKRWRDPIYAGDIFTIILSAAISLAVGTLCAFPVFYLIQKNSNNKKSS